MRKFMLFILGLMLNMVPALQKAKDILPVM